MPVVETSALRDAAARLAGRHLDASAAAAAVRRLPGSDLGPAVESLGAALGDALDAAAAALDALAADLAASAGRYEVTDAAVARAAGPSPAAGDG